MPELPEIEITARLLDRALAGAQIESALAPGLNALRSFEIGLGTLTGGRLESISRRGKLFLLILRAADGQDLVAIVHLMSAGRLQLYDRHATPRDRTSRVLIRLSAEHPAGTTLPTGSELRLREFGTKQAAWFKLLSRSDLADEETLAALGPDAWPKPPTPARLAKLLDAPRPLYTLLRDQHVIAGIGRSWVDEILHAAKLSPFQRGSDLSKDEISALRAAIVGVLGGAISHYEQTLALPIPDKLPMPLRVHRRNGSPCPVCDTQLEAVFFEDYVMCYCPSCQTDGKLLKDRRLSRLLK